MTEMAAMEVAQADHEYRKSYEVYSRHKIQSPVSGVITSVEKKVGEWVEPGTDLIRVVRLDRLRIEGFIAAEQTIEDLVGRNARVSVAMGDKTHETTGIVVFVSPDVNSVNSQVRVFLEIDNSKRLLRPGLQVKTSILAQP
jgi:multidrug resistance efflux pump